MTDEKIIIRDEETKLIFTPKTMGEVIIDKVGDELDVYVEKVNRG